MMVWQFFSCKSVLVEDKQEQRQIIYIPFMISMQLTDILTKPVNANDKQVFLSNDKISTEIAGPITHYVHINLYKNQ